MSNLQSLKQNLTACLSNYTKNDLIVSDKDVTNFINLLSEYDNCNNTTYCDDLYECLELCNFDDIKDYIINQSNDLATLFNYFSDVKDSNAEYYIADGMGGFKNIEVIDLINFVNDYIYEK